MTVLINVAAFFFLLGIVVFVHEFGHYIVAVLSGAKVDEFALGYGRELWGRVDRRGTRWKICVLPLGGFCKFFGDSDASSSAADTKKLNSLSPEEKKKCLYFKNVWQRMAVAAAGPLFNYILAATLFSAFFMVYGKNIITNRVTKVTPDSPAYLAGIRDGDRIIEIDGDYMEDFEEIQFKILLSKSDALKIKVLRDEEELFFAVSPAIVEQRNIFNHITKTPQIGIASDDFLHLDAGFFESISEGVKKTFVITKNTLKSLGQMIIGKRGLEDLSGPIKIAQYSGQALRNGAGAFVFFIAVISASLGLANLLPIPILDGGHIFICLLEAIRGKRLGEKAELALFRAGMGFLTFLMVFVILKDFIGIFK
ncbi:MAG: RIP metalloprotease RseP [Rickettsiales bacterium]|jgi:regulator of sigma E protease|nr:RIP metalloprotease RseP [Rickettsiales bacterium]